LKASETANIPLMTRMPMALGIDRSDLTNRPTSSVVQLRVYAQDAKSGELFWSNRGEFEVTRSADHRVLFDRAAREVIDALMLDFFGER